MQRVCCPPVRRTPRPPRLPRGARRPSRASVTAGSASSSTPRWRASSPCAGLDQHRAGGRRDLLAAASSGWGSASGTGAPRGVADPQRCASSPSAQAPSSPRRTGCSSSCRRWPTTARSDWTARVASELLGSSIRKRVDATRRRGLHARPRRQPRPAVVPRTDRGLARRQPAASARSIATPETLACPSSPRTAWSPSSCSATCSPGRASPDRRRSAGRRATRAAPRHRADLRRRPRPRHRRGAAPDRPRDARRRRAGARRPGLRRRRDRLGHRRERPDQGAGHGAARRRSRASSPSSASPSSTCGTTSPVTRLSAALPTTPTRSRMQSDLRVHLDARRGRGSALPRARRRRSSASRRRRSATCAATPRPPTSGSRWTTDMAVPPACEVEDDGVGNACPREQHFGLQTMRERADAHRRDARGHRPPGWRDRRASSATDHTNSDHHQGERQCPPPSCWSMTTS